MQILGGKKVGVRAGQKKTSSAKGAPHRRLTFFRPRKQKRGFQNEKRHTHLDVKD